MEIIFQYFQLCISENSASHTAKLVGYSCFTKDMPSHFPPYFNSIKWQVENTYDEPAENIMTLRCQSSSRYTTKTTLHWNHALLLQGVALEDCLGD